MLGNSINIQPTENACFVIGNGPSLKGVSNKFLETLPSFGSNRIYLRFTPTYYACVNPLVLAQYWDDILRLKCQKFVKEGFVFSPDVTHLHSTTVVPFSKDPEKYINEGYTVTYVCLQLAYWMGFQKVYLVGVDHRYISNGKPNEEKVWKGEDPNHFDPNYFKDAIWNNADLENSEKFYKIAKKVYERDGREIINLTENTALDVFEKGKIWAA